MAIDSSIYGQIQQFKPESQLNSLANILQVQGAQQANQLNQMKMDEYQKGVERKNKLTALMGGFTDEMTDDQKVGALTRGGFLDEAKTFGEYTSKIAKEKREAEKFKIEGAMKKLELAGQIMSGVKDQDSYNRARLQAQAYGLDVSNMPEQYNPALIEESRQKALTVQQQLEQVWKQKGYDLDVQRAAEVARHNRTSEGLTARGQNMTDARARETAQLQKDAARVQVVETPEGVMLVDKGTGLARPAATFDGKNLPGKQPESVKKELLSINQQKSVIQGAIDAVDKTPSAFGFGRGVAGKLPFGETLAGRGESGDETQARAYVFNNVSRVINERAGAAQSAQELARLNAFLPADTDSPTQIKNKLVGFQKYLADLEAGTTGKPVAPSKPSPSSAPSRVNSDADYNALPSGAVFIGPDGKQRRKP